MEDEIFEINLSLTAIMKSLKAFQNFSQHNEHFSNFVKVKTSLNDENLI